LVAAAHSASVAHARQAFVAQIGWAGTFAHPPVESQSTHLWVDTLHRSSVPVQSPSLRHSPHDEPPMQKRCAPVPEQAAFDPQLHSRFVQALANSGSHADAEQAAHCATLVRTQAATPALSQHSWLFEQPRAPLGSHAPHCPF